jgi:hypothetical protein
MDEKERKMISFQVSADELEVIEARAAKRGSSRSEYLRARAITDPEDTDTGHLEALIKHAIYTINQTHTAHYSIAEAEGKAGRFLSTEELREVYARVRVEAIRYALEFPERFAAAQAEIAAAAQNGAK